MVPLFVDVDKEGGYCVTDSTYSSNVLVGDVVGPKESISEEPLALWSLCIYDGTNDSRNDNAARR